jgi:hypothetical protein
MLEVGHLPLQKLADELSTYDCELIYDMVKYKLQVREGV